MNGQHGTIADIRSCDGVLFDVKLQAAVGRSAQPEFLHDLRPDELVLVPRTQRRIFGVTSGPDKQQRQQQRPQPRQQRQQKSAQLQRLRPLPSPQRQPLGVPRHELPRRILSRPRATPARTRWATPRARRWDLALPSSSGRRGRRSRRGSSDRSLGSSGKRDGSSSSGVGRLPLRSTRRRRRLGKSRRDLLRAR